MGRMRFNSEGRIESVDANLDNYSLSADDYDRNKIHLKKSSELEFLKDENKFEEIIDNSSWSLHHEGGKLEPLRFSNSKTQEDVVNEVVKLIKDGTKIVLIHGMCGTGKSAIALNIARILGRTSIVVPVKGLQRQYEEDYMAKKYLKKKNGKKMKIAMITGRDNHDSIIQPGVSCANPDLPEMIKLVEKNYDKIKEYYLENPMISGKDMPEISKLKRISIAPANPYWSPISPATYELPLRDAKKKKYIGLNGREFIFWHRKTGCSYYDQYQAYIDADVLIFNSAKYKIEVAMNRKPSTEVEIIDEADEFLDNFSTEEDINLTRLTNALKSVKPEEPEAQEAIESIQDFIELEEKNKRALGIDESAIFHVGETKVAGILRLFLKNPWIEAESSLDEVNYTNHAIEVARTFDGFLEDTYVTFERKEKDLYVHLVATNLSKRFKEIIDKNKAIVMMSGTLHSERVLKEVFGISEFKIVEAETLHQGSIDVMRTGREFDCKYANFAAKRYTRRDYLLALASCIAKAQKPILVHVNSFEDLPTENEVTELGIYDVMSRERLKLLQADDKTGRLISLFKSKLSDSLFTTKCSRGVDFPGDVCNSVIFT
jgi:Rad3-related DNA helicase